MTRLQTIVTHLAMEPPFRQIGAVDWPSDVSFAKVEAIPIESYRALYDAVGRKWHWVNRRNLTDKQLAGLIHHKATEIYVLSRGGAAIGYVELNFRLFPQVEIVFVGLVEEEIGKGLGTLMVRQALALILSRSPHRIIIQTCTLDHPSALGLYQKYGFYAVNRKQVEIIDA